MYSRSGKGAAKETDWRSRGSGECSTVGGYSTVQLRYGKVKAGKA